MFEFGCVYLLSYHIFPVAKLFKWHCHNISLLELLQLTLQTALWYYDDQNKKLIALTVPENSILQVFRWLSHITCYLWCISLWMPLI